jgi:hypothetical protein
LQYYLEHISKISSIGGVNALTKSNKKSNSFDPQKLISGEDYYIYEITEHKFYRIIDLSKFHAFLKRTATTFAMAKAMLIEMPYKLVLSFAKPIKKIDNLKLCYLPTGAGLPCKPIWMILLKTRHPYES